MVGVPKSLLIVAARSMVEITTFATGSGAASGSNSPFAIPSRTVPTIGSCHRPVPCWTFSLGADHLAIHSGSTLLYEKPPGSIGNVTVATFAGYRVCTMLKACCWAP